MKEVERMELAADWLQRLQSSPQDEALLKEWLQWCQSDPQNLAAFDRVRIMWDSFDNPTVRKIAQEGRRRQQFRAGGSRRLAKTFAIAATVLMGVGGGGGCFLANKRGVKRIAASVAPQDKQNLT